jgi:PleD family two-component response regulator
MRILIADDDAFSSMLLAQTLKRLGHEVTTASDGRAAFEKYEREPFPLVITDWMMPNLDGLELCRLIRASAATSYTYIIILTVLEGKGSYLQGLEAGGDDFVSKPFDEETLAARLRVAERILRLMTENRQLAELIPVCSYCMKARNDKDYWENLDRFLMKKGAQMTHGVCPECFEKAVKSME